MSRRNYRATSGAGDTIYRLDADVLESAATLTNAIQFTPAPSTQYLIELFLVWEADATTTGIQYQITDNTGGVTYGVSSLQTPTAATTQVARYGPIGNPVQGTGVGGANTRYPAGGWAVVQTAAGVSGTIALQFRSEIALSVVTLRAGSFMRVRVIA